MANTPEPTKEDAVRRRRFMLLAGVGAVVIVLGVILPRLFVGSVPEPAPKQTKEASAKALPPLDEKRPAPGETIEPKKEAAKPPELPDAPSMGAILTRLVGGTVFVLLVCAGTTWGIGRWMRGKNKIASAGPLRIVASLRLNARCSVVLVQAGDQHLVAGLDATGLKAMLHLPGGIGEATEEVEAVPQAVATDAPPILISARVPIIKASEMPSRIAG